MVVKQVALCTSSFVTLLVQVLVLRRLQHGNIANLYEVIEDVSNTSINNQIYLIFEVLLPCPIGYLKCTHLVLSVSIQYE